MQQRQKMTTMIQQMILGDCVQERSTPILRPSQLGRTRLTWTRMKRKCSLKLVRVWPIPGDRHLPSNLCTCSTCIMSMIVKLDVHCSHTSAQHAESPDSYPVRLHASLRPIITQNSTRLCDVYPECLCRSCHAYLQGKEGKAQVS